MPVIEYPVRITKDFASLVLRTEADAAMVVGHEHARALLRLLKVTPDRDIDIGFVDLGGKETLIARVASDEQWIVRAQRRQQRR